MCGIDRWKDTCALEQKYYEEGTIIFFFVRHYAVNGRELSFCFQLTVCRRGASKVVQLITDMNRSKPTLRPRSMALIALVLLFVSGIWYVSTQSGEQLVVDALPPISKVSVSARQEQADASTKPLEHKSSNIQIAFPPVEKGNVTRELLPEPSIEECARGYFERNYERSLQATSDAERRQAVLPSAMIDKVYMIHYTPMKKRKVAMTEMMAKHGVSVQWVDGFDKEVLNDTTASCFHAFHPEVYEKSNTPSERRKAHRHDQYKYVPLGKSQRSVVTKHHSALYDAYRFGYSNSLVLEDDAYLRVNFTGRLGEIMRSVPSTYDVIMIGGCMNMHAWRRKYKDVELVTKHLYKKREARCAHAYVVSQKGVRHLLSSVPLTQAIDFQMTSAMKEREMEVYWVEPWLSVQGPSTECVTNIDLGAACVSIEKNLGNEYDPRFAEDTAMNALWDMVPAMKSKR